MVEEVIYFVDLRYKRKGYMGLGFYFFLGIVLVVYFMEGLFLSNRVMIAVKFLVYKFLGTIIFILVIVRS